MVSDDADAARVRTVDLDEPWAERQMLIGLRAGGPGLSDVAQGFLAHCREAAARSAQGRGVIPGAAADAAADAATGGRRSCASPAPGGA